MRATILLIVVTVALGNSLFPQRVYSIKEVCCEPGSNSRTCSKPDNENKKTCNTDYCNPFQSCSTTPILMTEILMISGMSSRIIEIGYAAASHHVFEFYSKYWQPPEAAVFESPMSII